MGANVLLCNQWLRYCGNSTFGSHIHCLIATPCNEKSLWSEREEKLVLGSVGSAPLKPHLSGVFSKGLGWSAQCQNRRWGEGVEKKGHVQTKQSPTAKLSIKKEVCAGAPFESTCFK